MTEPEVTLQHALDHGLTREEYSRILEILGRTPTFTELGMFSVMWSEHCSYKNSIAELKKLPRSGGRLLVEAGEENAGLVDFGDGLAIAFKIESHNHPSAVEPYQGAATGVGGIMRDIFTMGARPIAALDSLRFGSPEHPKTQYLVKGIVKGIGDYGNSFGVPTVAGEVYFDECYNENPIVNAMAIGVVKHNEVARAIAKGPGNSVLIVGSATGRDGIHGATFASEEISEESESRRPSVQVGDPFTEKLLLEATLEAIKSGYVVGVQDMGAAGITCSASEMSAKAGGGMSLNLDDVPARESNMSAYELMLSESQERMLLVVAPENEDAVRRVFEKWDLSCQRIGQTISENKLIVHKGGKKVVDVPAECLVLGGGAPVYIRESRVPEYLNRVRELDLTLVPEPRDYEDCLIRLLQSPNICSRRWIYTQYDTMVRTNTVIPGRDAAVIRIKGSNKWLAAKTDCNPRYAYLDPRRGAQIAVAESARNVVCVGATPLAITNCLNFGNPYKPEIYWQFRETIAGISEACKVLGTPVTGGNVSFYNESADGGIHPTPVIGMIGEIESPDQILTPWFKQKGDIIVLLGDTRGHLGGTEYLKVVHRKAVGDAPELDLVKEKRLQDCCLILIRSCLLSSAHDTSEGGLAVALAECCMNGEEHGERFGAQIELNIDGRVDAYLFGEDQSRILVSLDRSNLETVLDICRRSGVSAEVIGTVAEDALTVNDLIHLQVSRMEDAYETGFSRILMANELI